MTHPWLKNYAEGVDWNSTSPFESLSEMFEFSAKKFSTKPFLEFMGKRFTYSEISKKINQFAEGLQDIGVRKGDRVGLFLPNTPYYVISYFAILKIGGVVVNFNPLYAEQELKHQINDSGVTLMVTLDLNILVQKLNPLLKITSLSQIIVCSMADILPFSKKLLFQVAKRKEIANVSGNNYRKFSDLIFNNGNPYFVYIEPDDDLAVLQYTGGTTGTPKGAMLTHTNLVTNANQCVDWMITAKPGQEKMLAVLPFFHVFSMTVCLNASVMLGCEIILLPKFELVDLLKTITVKKPTLFPAVPTIYTAINHHPKLSNYNLSSINICISGGAPLPFEVKELFEKNTGCVLIEGYGLSECSPVACINPIKGTPRKNSVGFPVPKTIVELVSLENGVDIVPIGEKGEICISGPQVMRGYWNKQSETDNVLKNGRLHTGDVGIMDDDGYVYIVDRIKDMILCGGYNVYPRNVEEAIYLHPSVEEVVVAGIPDEYRGQTVKAFIKLKDGEVVSPADLKEFLKDKLSPIESPKLIEFRDSLPKTMIGKLSRKELLEEIQHNA